MKTRQVVRRELVSARLERFEGHAVPKDLLPRKERRKLARALAAGDWKKRPSA